MARDQILGELSTICAFASAGVAIFMAICAIFGIKMVNKNINRYLSSRDPSGESKAQQYQERKFLLQIVAAMAICDFFFATVMVAKYLALAAPDSVGDSLSHLHTFCVIVGVWGQFWGVSSIVWNCILVLAFFRVSYGQATFETITNEAEGKRYICAVGSVALVCSGIPLIFGAYGYIRSSHESPFNCWINLKGFQLFLYVPALLCGILFMLCMCYIKIWARDQSETSQTAIAAAADDEEVDVSINNSGGSSSIRILLARGTGAAVAGETRKYLMWFSAVFCLVWSLPAMERIVIMAGGSAPEWMVYEHDLLISSLGWINGIFWLKIIRSVYAPVVPAVRDRPQFITEFRAISNQETGTRSAAKQVSLLM